MMVNSAQHGESGGQDLPLSLYLPSLAKRQMHSSLFLLYPLYLLYGGGGGVEGAGGNRKNGVKAQIRRIHIFFFT
jgi:hypothetical protein